MRQPTLTEQKLVILYTLDKLGASTALQLLRFLVENELMDYIEMQIATAELTEAGLLRRPTHELGPLYALSEQGHQALSMFQQKIPYSRREQIERVARVWRQRFREEKQVLADFVQQESGEYLVRLRLLEQELNLLDLSLSVPTREQAHQMIKNWPERAGEVYRSIMEKLGEEGNVTDGDHGASDRTEGSLQPGDLALD